MLQHGVPDAHVGAVGAFPGRASCQRNLSLVFWLRARNSAWRPDILHVVRDDQIAFGSPD